MQHQVWRRAVWVWDPNYHTFLRPLLDLRNPSRFANWYSVTIEIVKMLPRRTWGLDRARTLQSSKKVDEIILKEARHKRRHKLWLWFYPVQVHVGWCGLWIVELYLSSYTSHGQTVGIDLPNWCKRKIRWSRLEGSASKPAESAPVLQINSRSIITSSIEQSSPDYYLVNCPA